MKSILLAFGLITKRKALNLILFIQVILAFYLLFPTVIGLYRSSCVEKTLSGLDFANAFYLYVYNNNSEHRQAAQQIIQQQAEELDYVNGIGEIYQYNSEAEDIYVWAYNDDLISNTTPKLTEGKWLQNADYDSGKIPAVVMKDTGYKLNESFSLPVITFNGQNEQTVLDCEVVGIIASPFDYIQMSGAAPRESFRPDMLLGDRYRSIIVPSNSLPNGEDIDHLSMGSLLFTDGSADYKQVQSDFGWYCWSNEMVYGNKVGSQTSISYTYFNICICIIFVVLTILAIISASIVQIANNQRIFQVYFMQGMSFGKGLRIELTRIGIIIADCMIGSIIMLNSTDLLYFYDATERLPIIIVLMFIYLIIAFVPISLGFFINISKKPLNLLASE